ncbi:MAG: VWA domain-containing protein [Gammaproteobacteria bacterium]|nr:MAG: VWA domain-containing protein [Gammaproteobacteria bacterium]
MIEFLWPWSFALLPLPYLLQRWLPATENNQAALRVPDLAPFVTDTTTGRQAQRFTVAIGVLWLAWLLLLGAVARPQITGQPVSLPTTGRDLMLAVDISGSMNTEDMELGGERLNRLAVVKNVVSDFIGRRQGDRVGLILFGSNAYLQVPLTFDLATVESLLREAPVGIAGGKTAIGDAIGLAVKRLRERPEESRVLILLTDGANNIGEVEPLKAAELAAVNNIRIYSIGVGAESLRLPGLIGILGSRLVNPSAGLDEATLRQIASTTGGRYFRARHTTELEDIYELLDRLEPVEQEAATYRPVRSLFHVPLAASWLLFMWCIGWPPGQTSGEAPGETPGKKRAAAP